MDLDEEKNKAKWNEKEQMVSNSWVLFSILVSQTFKQKAMLSMLFRKFQNSKKISHGTSCAKACLDSWVQQPITRGIAVKRNQFISIPRNGDDSIPPKKTHAKCMRNHSKIYVQIREGIQDLPQWHQANSKLGTVKMFFGLTQSTVINIYALWDLEV